LTFSALGGTVAALMQPRRQYLLLALLRVAFALAAWGVVHPDELFQSVEVRARPRHIM
jgi:hypothetical protein